MSGTRIALGAAGLLLMGFGAFRFVTEIPVYDLVVLALWLIGALVIHDGILSPIVIGVGVALTRLPVRARRYVQAALIAGGSVTVIAIPMIYREDTQPPNKAILLQNFAANLSVLLGLIAAVTLVLYALRVARDGTGSRPTAAHEANAAGPRPGSE